MGLVEKIADVMQHNEQKKEGLRKSILKLMSEWDDFEEGYDTTTTCLRKCFNEVDAKEKHLIGLQESVEQRREEVEVKEREHRALCEREMMDLKCKWKELGLARKGFDEIVKLREEHVSEQEKIVERLWGETEFERKRLEELNKSVVSKVSMKEKEFEERLEESNQIQSWIREETDALLLKERKFTERVEEFEIKEKILLSKEKEMEARERDLDNVRKEFLVKLNDQEKMVERLCEETECKRKQLENLNKSVENMFTEISVKQKEFEERSEEFSQIQSWIREETDALLLKERKFTERVEEFEIKEKILLSKEKEMETRERDLDYVRKELFVKGNCLDSVKKELRMKETALESVKKDLIEAKHNLDSIQRKLREKETALGSVSMELEAKVSNLDSVTKQLTIKEDCLSLVDGLELKGESVDSIKKKLELREQELTSFKEKLQLREGAVRSIKRRESARASMQKCDGKFQFEKNTFQKEQALLKEKLEDVALKEKQVEVRFKEVKQREKHIEDRLKVLEEKEKQLKTTCNVPVETKPIDNVDVDRVGAVTRESADIRFFVTRDGKSLQIYLNEREQALDSMSDDVFKALQFSLNPGQLVLEAMEGFYPPHLRKGDIEFEGNVARQSCVLLLEQLIRVSPKIQPIVQEAAMELAREWKVKLRVTSGNQLEILGFLYLLAAYSLVSAFDANELVSLLTIVVEHKKSKKLCHLLGVSEKISCIIQNLIDKQQHLEAVKYAYALDLVDQFSPIPILKDYFKQVMQILENVRSRETCSVEEKNEVIGRSIASIRAVIRCIVDHELQSQYPISQLEECIESLAKQKGDATASSVISEAQKPQQTQLKQMAPTCLSVPKDTKALSSTSSSEKASTCKLGHSNAFAVILVRMGGKNLQALLSDHWAELELFRFEVSVALKISTDSGMLVLEALGGFYPPEPHKEEIEFNHSIIRRTCIFLLEQLMRISPDITPKAKSEASKLASDWKAKIITEKENHLPILGFLLLVEAYGLTSAFNKNELESLCSTVAQHANETLIFRVLGISVVESPVSHANSERLSNVERSKQRNLNSCCTSSVVHGASDPAKIVLDALRKCYSADGESSSYVCTEERKRRKLKDVPSVMNRSSEEVENTSNLSKKVTKRFSGLLEQLREVSPEIRPQVKIMATEFAAEWRTTLTNTWEVIVFLQLLATFEVSYNFDSDDLLGLLKIVQHKKKAIDLIKFLGLADKIPGCVEFFIRRGELLQAFTYIYEFELVDSFSPLCILKNYVLHSIEQAKQISNGCCSGKVQKKVKAAVTCIEQHGLQSGCSLDELRAQIVEIGRLMATPSESLCAPNPHAAVSSRGSTTVLPNSSHLTQHYVPGPRIHPSNFRVPTLQQHPSQFMQHNMLHAPPGGQFSNYSGPNVHFMAASGVPRPIFPNVNSIYHQRPPCTPNVIRPSYFS